MDSEIHSFTDGKTPQEYKTISGPLTWNTKAS